MMKKFLSIFFCISLVFLTFLSYFNVEVYAENEDYTDSINQRLETYHNSIIDNVKNRTAGGEGEKYLASQLSDYMQGKGLSFVDGKTSYLQEFKFGNDLISNNVVGIKNNESDKYVIIGAHYDAVYRQDKSFGYNDNMSGVVATMLTCENLISRTLNYNVIVVFFGAEEVGCYGSKYFVSNLPIEIRDNILLFINLDSVGAGDYLYFQTSDFPSRYSNCIEETLKNEAITKYNNELFTTTITNGINYTNLPILSDMASFLTYGINSMMFFAGNLQTKNGLGFFETENHEKIMHNTDSAKTTSDVFGTGFVTNISDTVNYSLKILTASNFTSENFTSNQVWAGVYSDWVLKGFGVIVILVMFAGYFIVLKISKRNLLKNKQTKKK